MPGQPVKRAMVAELERRAKELGPDIEAIDYVCEWTAGGGTLRSLCRDLVNPDKLPGEDKARAGIGHSLEGGVLSSWVNSKKEWQTKIRAARVVAADNLVEEATEILDDADEDKDALTKAKARAEHRTWLASKWNRPQYGADVAAVNVQVNLPGQHLEALRQLQAKTPPLLPLAGPDVEIVPEGE